jgi:hypothetical protein
MNKIIKKSMLLILIATILIAPSMAIMPTHAVESQPPPVIVTIFPPTSNLEVLISSGSSTPPSFFFGGDGEGPGAVPLQAYGIVTLPELPGLLGFYYEVSVVNFAPFSLAEVCVHYDPTGMTLKQQKNLRLFIGDPVDFNTDGTVNVQDIVLMLKAIQSGAYDPRFDINHDGFVNFADLAIVVQFATRGLIVNQGGCLVRLPWMDITACVDTVNHYVCGFTGHFSGFGIHS